MTGPDPGATAEALAAEVLGACRARRWRVATAESCTGGMVAAALTGVAGSSDVVDRAFVTYANAAKTEMLGVPAGLIAAVGAVSEAVAARMAEGARSRAGVELAVAITGIAGPGGGGPGKPVGLVWFGLSVAGRPGAATHRRVFPGDRSAVRQAATRFALRLLRDAAITAAP